MFLSQNKRLSFTPLLFLLFPRDGTRIFVHRRYFVCPLPPLGHRNNTMAFPSSIPPTESSFTKNPFSLYAPSHPISIHFLYPPSRCFFFGKTSIDAINTLPPLHFFNCIYISRQQLLSPSGQKLRQSRQAFLNSKAPLACLCFCSIRTVLYLVSPPKMWAATHLYKDELSPFIFQHFMPSVTGTTHYYSFFRIPVEVVFTPKLPMEGITHQ